MSEYNEHSIDATLARIEAKLDVYAVTQARHGMEIEELKKWRWFSAGIGAGLAFIADKLFGK